MKRFLSPFFLMVLLCSCDREYVPVEVKNLNIRDWRVDYSAGQHWHFETTNDGDKIDDVFISSFEKDDTILLAAVIKSKWGEWETITRYEDREDGLYRVDNGNMTIDGALRSLIPMQTESKVMSYPIEIGKTWVAYTFWEFPVTKEYVKDTIITTDAGKRNCVRVDVFEFGSLSHSEYVSEQGIVMMKKKQSVYSHFTGATDYVLFETRLNYYEK